MMTSSGREPTTGVLKLLVVGLASIFCGGLAYAQGTSPDNQVLHYHIMKARKIAGSDLIEDFNHRCFIEPLHPLIAKGINALAPVTPTQVFDNLYFVGQNNVSSWVIKTSAGLILVDTQNNPTEARDYIEGGMAKLGLHPRQLRYIVITHEHADHFGGSKYLQDKYRQDGIRVVASAAAWDNMHPKDPPPPAPAAAGPCGSCNYYLAAARDIVMADGQALRLGDATLTFYVTPGHTDGTLSFIFNTTDHGVPHVVGFFGGMGSPRTEVNRDKIIRSYERWLKITAVAGVDTLIANHQGEDHAVENTDFIRIRQAGDPNPFVLGRDAYHRYFEVQDECTKADLARHGESIPD